MGLGARWIAWRSGSKAVLQESSNCISALLSHILVVCQAQGQEFYAHFLYYLILKTPKEAFFLKISISQVSKQLYQLSKATWTASQPWGLCSLISHPCSPQGLLLQDLTPSLRESQENTLREMPLKKKHEVLYGGDQRSFWETSSYGQWSRSERKENRTESEACIREEHRLSRKSLTPVKQSPVCITRVDFQNLPIKGGIMNTGSQFSKITNKVSSQKRIESENNASRPFRNQFAKIATQWLHVKL